MKRVRTIWLLTVCLSLSMQAAKYRVLPHETPKKAQAELNEQLHKAVSAWDVAKARSSLLGGADPNARDEKGYTVVHSLCRSLWGMRTIPDACDELLFVLLRHSADPNRGNVVSGDGRLRKWLPLQFAVVYGTDEMCYQLLGADGHLTNQDGLSPAKRRLYVATCRGWDYDIREAHRSGVNLNAISLNLTSQRPPLLYYAIAHDQLKSLLALLAAGVDLKMGRKDGWTALHAVVAAGCPTMIDALKVAGADLDAQTEAGWGLKGGRTALHEASSRGSSKVVHALITAGASVDIRDEYGRTPLFDAVRRGSQEVIRFLCRSGADCTISDHTGNTVLQERTYASAGSEKTALMRILIDAGAPVNATNRDGDSPLHTAARDWRCECVTVLLECGARVNVRNNKGDTPLHVMADDDEIASALLNAGADENAQNNEGNTPLHEMVQQGNEKLVALLLRNGADRTVVNYEGQKAKDL